MGDGSDSTPIPYNYPENPGYNNADIKWSQNVHKFFHCYTEFPLDAGRSQRLHIF